MTVVVDQPVFFVNDDNNSNLLSNSLFFTLTENKSTQID
jgi:hypothetical protein